MLVIFALRLHHERHSGNWSVNVLFFIALSLSFPLRSQGKCHTEQPTHSSHTKARTDFIFVRISDVPAGETVYIKRFEYLEE